MSKVKAGEAFVAFTVDNGPLKSGLRVVSREISAFEAGSTVAVNFTVNGIKAAVEQVAELESKFLTLQGVTGKTGEQLKGLEEKAKKLGASTSWTAAQVTDGMIALSRMGQTTEQIGASIEPVMNLAKGLGVEVDTAAGMVGAALNQFSLSADSAAHIADVLAKATNGAAISNAELSESLKYAGTAGAQAGQTLETVTALIMALRNAGLSAEQAGTSIRSFFLALQDEKKGRSFAQTFNVEVKDKGGNLRDINAILAEASVKAKELGGSLTASLSAAGIDSSAIGAVATLLRDSAELPSIVEGLKGADNYAAELAGTMDKGLAGSIAIAKSSIDGLNIAIGEALSPTVSTAAGEISRFVGNLTDLVKENKAAIVSAASTAAKIGAASVAVKALATSFTVLKSGWGTLKGVVKTLDALGGSGKNLKALRNILPEGETENFVNGIRKAERSAAELSSRFSELKVKTGDINAAERAFSDELKRASGLSGKEAAAVAKVARGVEEGTVSAKTFNRAIGDSTKAAGKLSTAFKALSVSAVSMIAIEAVVEAGKELYNWFNKSYEAARAAREEIEKAAEVEKEARRAAFDKGGVKETKETVTAIFDNIRNWSSKTAEERAAARNQFEEAKRNGVLSDESYKRVSEMTAEGARAYSSAEVDSVEREARNAALKAGAERAGTAAAETIKINRQTVADKMVIENGGSDTVALKNIATATQNAMNKGVKEALTIARDQSLSDYDKATKIAEVKKQTRAELAGLQNQAKAGIEDNSAKLLNPFGNVSKSSWENAAAGIETALNLFEESIDAAAGSIDYLKEVTAEAGATEAAAVDSFAFLADNQGTTEANERASFVGTTANDYQLGLKVDDEEGRKADKEAEKAAKEAQKAAERKAKADEQAAKEARKLAESTAEEAAAKLKATRIEDITAEQLSDVVGKLNAAENLGVNMDNERGSLSESFKAVASQIVEASNVQTSVSSRVFTDSISAAFSLSNRTSEDYQRQQLHELQKLADNTAAQVNAVNEILSLL